MADLLVRGLRFLPASHATWLKCGPISKATMLYTAEKQPAVFFATCARLLPNDVRVTVEQSLPGNLSMEDWQMMKEIIAAVRQAIPDASSKPPGAVLEHVLSALKQADAKLIG